MSIIYDALKKTQKARNETTEVKIQEKSISSSRPRYLPLIMISVVILLVAINFFQYTSHSKQPPVIKSPVSPANVAEDETYKKHHILNGVFLSDNEKVAMINSKFYHLGNTVDGLRLVRMKLNQVTLKNDKLTVTLEMATF